MKNDELANHIPNYPDFEDPNFNGKMNAKVEIQKLRQTSTQFKKGSKDSVFFNHQKLQTVYLGPQTSNKYLLIWHDPGLGKTGTAIGIAETRHDWLDQYISSKDQIIKLNTHKALIIAQNKNSLADNFTRDIMTKFTAGSYVTEKLKTGKYKTEAAKKGSETRSVEHSYDLETHGAFAKRLSKLSDQDIAKIYSFRVIIIDEAHILKTIIKSVETESGRIINPTTEAKGTKFSHTQLMRLKNNVYGSVIVITTGTPTVNIIDEFPSLINFITDRDNQVDPVTFIPLTKLPDLNQMRFALEEYLVPKIVGRVSRMKLADSQRKSIVRHNDQVPLLKNSDKRLWITKIDNNNPDDINYDYIQNAYRTALGVDNIASNQQNVKLSDDSFYQSSLFANNMIWPGGLSGYRDAAFDTYLIKAFDTYMEKGKEKLTNVRYAFSNSFLEDFRRRVNDVRTNQINVLRNRELPRKQQERQNLIISLGLQDANFEDVEKPEELELVDDEIDFIEDHISLLERTRGELDANGIYTGTYNASVNMDVSNMEEEFEEELERASLDIDIMLLAIKTYYSPMFATAIQQIIGIETYDAENKRYEYVANSRTNNFYLEEDPRTSKFRDNRECAYFYNFYIEGGIVPAALFLERFGYKQLEGNYFVDVSTGEIVIPKGKRYALIFGDTTMITPAKISQILKLANHPANKYGHYLKVIFGTDVSALGVNLLNIRQAHLTYRKWNEAGNIQTEGRVDRLNSHEAFEDNEIDEAPLFEYDLDPETNDYLESIPIGVTDLNGKRTQKYVKIFRHANIYGQGLMSIAVKMYEDAAEKELKNSVITNIMESLAYDNLINLFENERPPAKLLKYTEMLPDDYITYNLFHAEKEIEQIKCKIRGFFKVYFSMKLSQIIRLLKVSSHQTTIIKALTDMINKDERLIDRHGMLCYLREEKDLFFLQKMPRTVGPTVIPDKNVTAGTGPNIQEQIFIQQEAKEKRIPTYNRSEQWMCHYSRHNYVKDKEDIEDMTYRLNYSVIDNVINEILRLQNPTKGKVLNLINNLSNYSKAIMVERLIQNSINNQIPKDVFDIIFAAMVPWVTFWPNNGVIIHSYNLKTRQENQSGGRSSFSKLPADSRGELRIFVLAENVWRNTNEGEDVFYIPLINDYSSRRSNLLSKDFSHFGISTIEMGKHIFRMNDRKQIIRSSQTFTQKGKVSGKPVTGLTCTSYNVSKLYDYLWSVKVDIYVQAIATSDGNLILLKLDCPENKTCEPSEMKVRILPNGSPDLIVLDPSKIKNRKENTVFTGIIHYTHVFPEILHWVFEKEFADLDPNELIQNEKFYPSLRIGNNDKEHYLPQDLPTMIGNPPRGVFPRGIILLLSPQLIELIYNDNAQKGQRLLKSSMELLLQNIYKGNLVKERENVYAADFVDPNLALPDQYNSKESVEYMNYGVRFRSPNVWFANKEQLCILIYLLFFMQGSIYYQ